MTTPLDVALWCVARGWPVFPVRWDKHPLIKWGVGASTDVKTVTQWWQRWPQALVGVPTGRRSGFIVLDVDVKDGRNGFDTLADLGRSNLPLTPIAHTRSGGVHVYFACIAIEIRNSEGEHGLGVGLDVRGEGGFVIIPSPNSGYRWDPECNFDTVPLMPAPVWLGYKQRKCQRVTAVKPVRPAVGLSAYGEAALDSACQRILCARAGDQEATLNAECFAIGTLAGAGGIPAGLARDVLEWAAGKLTNYDASRPWSATELKRKVDAAFNAGMRRPRRAKP